MVLTIPYGWEFIPRGSSSRMDVLNGTSLTGIAMVTVSDGLGNVLTFSGVRREADGGAVVCLAVGSIYGVTVAKISANFLAVLSSRIIT